MRIFILEIIEADQVDVVADFEGALCGSNLESPKATLSCTVSQEKRRALERPRRDPDRDRLLAFRREQQLLHSLFSRPAMILNKVVLPQPLPPTMADKLPGSMVKRIFVRAKSLP